jgi:hypothetical protein
MSLIMENNCPIAPSDYGDFFNALSSTPNGITAMNYFLYKYFTDLVNNVKDGRNIAKTIISIIAPKVSIKSEIENVTRFFYYIMTISETLLVITIINMKLYS